MEILFIYKGEQIIIQCNIEDKMKDIINKFKSKIKEEDNNLNYIYNGEKINKELKLNQIIKDKNGKKINILVYNSRDKENEKEIISNKIICPNCKENILINIKDDKLNLNEYKKGFKIQNILDKSIFSLFSNSFNFKLISNKRNINNRNNIYNKELCICNECNINFCLSCKSKYDNNYNIINVNDKNYIYEILNNRFIDCLEKNNYYIVEILNIISKNNELLKGKKYLIDIIHKFKNNIEEFKNILIEVLNNIEIKFKIDNNIINNNKNGNYENYYTLNEINNSTINELYNINNENKINDKLKNTNNIYNKKKLRINFIKIYENGDIYIDEYKNELKNGKGIIYYNKNEEYERNRYEGNFKDDKREGKGIYNSNDGERYKSDLKDNKIERKVIYYFNNGNIHESDLKDDKREGKGIYYFNDGDRYEGDWKDDKKEGKGLYYFNNGNRYNGDWKNDKMEGKGIYCFNNGQRYEGEWVNDKKEGKGIYYWNNGEFQGDRYDGEWKNDNYEGKGIYYYNDGSRYEGDFKKGKREGKGIYYYYTGNSYEGDWKDDKREGKGVYYFINGDREMGDYLDNKEIGVHAMLKANGKVTANNYD